MFSLVEPPLFARLRPATSVLVAGAGGGFDAYAGLPACRPPGTGDSPVVTGRGRVRCRPEPAHGLFQQAAATGSLEPVSTNPSLIHLPSSRRFHRSVGPHTPCTVSPRAVQAMETTVPFATVPTAS